MSELQLLVDDLCLFMQNKFKFKNKPKIELVADKVNASNTFGKTAHYNPEDSSIVLYTTNRHPKDILRSLAHEIIHHVQNDRGDFKETDTADTVNDGYEQRDPKLWKIEEEAFSKGNMTFREWEHMKKSNLKEKPAVNEEDQKKDLERSKKELKKFNKASKLIKDQARQDAKEDAVDMSVVKEQKEQKEKTKEKPIIKPDERPKEIQDYDKQRFEHLKKLFTK